MSPDRPPRRTRGRHRTYLSKLEKGVRHPRLEIIAQSLCWRSPAGVSGSSEHC